MCARTLDAARMRAGVAAARGAEAGDHGAQSAQRLVAALQRRAPRCIQRGTPQIEQDTTVSKHTLQWTMRARTHARTHKLTHTRACTQALARTHARTHTHTHTPRRCAFLLSPEPIVRMRTERVRDLGLSGFGMDRHSGARRGTAALLCSLGHIGVSHMCATTRAHIRARTCMTLRTRTHRYQPWPVDRACLPGKREFWYAHAHAHTHTRSHTHALSRTRARTHALTRTRTRAHRKLAPTADRTLCRRRLERYYVDGRMLFERARTRARALAHA
jgi:hypothetical protein